MNQPSPADRAAFEELGRLIDPEGSARYAISLDFAPIDAEAGDAEHVSVPLPQDAVKALYEIARAVTQGQTLRLVPKGAELTTQAAADLLDVSRPHLIKLIDQGAIACHMVGTHRRLRSDDVLAYREGRDTARRARVRSLQRQSARRRRPVPEAPAE